MGQHRKREEKIVLGSVCKGSMRLLTVDSDTETPGTVALTIENYTMGQTLTIFVKTEDLIAAIEVV